MLNDVEKVLISEEEIKQIVKKLGKKISEDYREKFVDDKYIKRFYIVYDRFNESYRYTLQNRFYGCINLCWWS